MTAAHVGLHLCEAVEEAHCSLLAPELDDTREPHDIAGLDTEPALPPGIEKSLVSPRQLVATHEPGVISDAEIRKPVGHPAAMGRDRLGDEIGEVRSVELGEDAFARHLLEVGADRFDGIELEAATACFGDGALRNLFAVRAPQVHLDAVLLLECL